LVIEVHKPLQIIAPEKWLLYGIYLPPIDQKTYLKTTCDPSGKGYYTSDKACAIHRVCYI